MISYQWRHGVVVIITAQLHLTKPELKFCAGLNPARGVLEIRDSEDLSQWSRLEIRPTTFWWSTIPQKQFLIFIIIINTPDLEKQNKKKYNKKWKQSLCSKLSSCKKC